MKFKKNELNNGNRRRNVIKKKMIMTFMYLQYVDIWLN